MNLRLSSGKPSEPPMDDNTVAAMEPTASSVAHMEDHEDREDTSSSNVPHGRVGGSATELARNLPELVDNLRRLRMEMEKCTKIYEAINLSQRASTSKMNGHSDELSPPGNCDSELFRHDEYGHEEEYDPMHTATTAPWAPRSSIMLRRPAQQHAQAQKAAFQPRPSMRMSGMMNHSISYSVMWVSGECGISLRNFSSNKIGAQIAVLQQADGVTTGISNCRLGDQLVTVNDDRVEDMGFKEIVQKLKSTRRPITLGFRTNQNVATSPTAASSLSMSMSRSTISSLGRTSLSGRASLSGRGFFPSDYDDFTTSSSSNTVLMDPVVDRQTNSSMRSSTSTLSDDVELFCKEQEEMHSDIIVLLTETVMRCEKLQQENLDQLQSLMQLAPNLHPHSPAIEGTSPEALLAMSSLAPVASPAEAVKLRASVLEASSSASTSTSSSNGLYSSKKSHLWAPTSA